MKHHTSNRFRVLVLLVVIVSGSTLACTESLARPVSGHQESGVVRVEVAFLSGDGIGTVVVALDRSPLEMLWPAWISASSYCRSLGLIDRTHRGVVLVRALGRAARAIMRHPAGGCEPAANGVTEEGSDADRCRPA